MTRGETAALLGALAVVVAGAVSYGTLLHRVSVVEEKVSEKADLSSLGENNCDWLEYEPRRELENTQKCPTGSYTKGLGFFHEGGENYTYQMSYKLFCCSLKADAE